MRSMLRHSLVLAALLATTLVSANGCQSCSSCHDYDPPVANCQCGGCEPQCGCSEGCSGGGCSSCACGNGSGNYTQEGQAIEMVPADDQMASPTNSQPTMQRPANAR
jgi:hypothetical protein